MNALVRGWKILSGVKLPIANNHFSAILLSDQEIMIFGGENQSQDLIF